MKSIRLSLIVYFLVLLTGALAGVSWFCYRTTSDSLHQRKRDAQTMIETGFNMRKKEAALELDRHLVTQARVLASMRLGSVHYEPLHWTSAIGGAALTQGYVGLAVGLPGQSVMDLPPRLRTNKGKGTPAPKNPRPADEDTKIHVPFWLAQWSPQWLPKGQKFEPGRELPFFPRYTYIEAADLLVADADSSHGQEYFQTFRGKDGQPMQHSLSMGNTWFTLDKEHRDNAVLFAEMFDDVEIRPGVRVRRVTLKAPISGFGGVMVWRWPARGAFGQGTQTIDTTTPTLFIQYAGELGPTEAMIRRFEHDRDGQLHHLEATIDHDLAQLRNRMLWISITTLCALWVGGYLVIRLGLAPLSKMSDAVSKVSAQNFHLPLSVQNLPGELQPIAERLCVVLDHLQKAFAREKQAAADISHELRTPLAALMTTLEVGLKKLRTPEEYREILDECRNSGQHMYQLVERLLTLARLDAGVDQYRPVRTDVTEIALNCADLVRPLARARGLTLRLHLPDPVLTETDPNKLREVITNLLHNAIEYNIPDGSIDFTVDRNNLDVRVEVHDTGIGIKPEQMEHLFERFYRADPSRHADTPHAGLGLAIVKSYVDLMGGTIKVESAGAGTSFIVEIPYVASIHDLDTAVQEAPALA